MVIQITVLSVFCARAPALLAYRWLETKLSLRKIVFVAVVGVVTTKGSDAHRLRGSRTRHS
jgi:hypothetical protein